MAEQQKDRWGIPSHQDLPRSARQRAIAQWARRLTPDEYREVHASLDGGSDGDRHTGLFLATVRRDLDRVVVALHDPALRSRALAAAGRLPVPDEALAEVAGTAPQAHRLALYRQLRRTGRRELADRLLPEVYDRYGRREAAQLLAACSPEAVHPWLSRVRLTDGVLVGLARSAPLAVVRFLADQERAELRGPRRAADRTPWRGMSRRLVTTATRRDPEAGLHLLATAPHLLTGEAAAELLTHRPGRLAELVRAGAIGEIPLAEGELTSSTARALRRLPEEQLVLLARVCRPTRRTHLHQGLLVEPLLALLGPDRRAEVASQLIEESTSGNFPAAGLVLALGAERRAALARSYLADRPARRGARLLRVVRLLPLAEAEERLAEVAGSPRHHERADGWAALLDCATAQGDPAEYARVVRLSARAWHDHPEVRQRALRRIAGAPEGLLAAVPAEVLRDAALTVAQARDTTAHCLRPMAAWLRRSTHRAAADGDLPRAAELTGLLAQLAGHPRAPRSATVELGFSVPVAEGVWDRLHATPAMRRPGRWLRLAAMLPPLPTVDARLEAYLLGGQAQSDRDGIRGQQQDESRELAAALWLRPAGGGRDVRCGRLVGADPASVPTEAGWEVLSRRRTDLLAGVFTRAREHGVAWAPPLPPGTGPQAAAAHTALVGPDVFDDAAEQAGRVAAARVLTDPVLLREAVERGPQPVAAAALWQVAQVAPPEEALPLVVSHLGGGGVRGRAAALAVRHLLARSAEGEAESLLTGWLTGTVSRVGVGAGKELVAALGDLSDRVVLRTALTVWDSPGLHRDVRARLAGLLTGFLDRPEVAARLSDALGEPAVWEAVSGAVAQERDAALRPALERFLGAATEHPDPDVADGAFTVLRDVMRADGPGAAAVERELLTFGQQGRIWRSAVRLIAGVEDGPAHVEVWTRVVDRLALLAQGGPSADDGSVAEQARTRLAALAGGQFGPEVGAPVLLDVLADRLAAVGLGGAAVRTAMVPAVRALVGGDPAAERWSRILDLLEGHPLRWTGLPEGLGLRWGDELPELALRAVLDQLRARGSAEGVVLAARLVGWITGRLRTPEWWSEELAAWRGHPDPDVAELMITVG
ncbi:hypothetical protein [Kitasatospora sp. NPDC004289]